MPFVNVADIGRSLRFYLLLGFEPLDTYPHDGEAAWAFLRSGGASIMLARTDLPIAHRAQEIFFYLYTNELDDLRDQLVADGLAPGEIVDGTPGPAARDAHRRPRRIRAHDRPDRARHPRRRGRRARRDLTASAGQH